DYTHSPNRGMSRSIREIRAIRLIRDHLLQCRIIRLLPFGEDAPAVLVDRYLGSRGDPAKQAERHAFHFRLEQGFQVGIHAYYHAALRLAEEEGIPADRPVRLRSEEHRLNSSHVKISYAVFCLTKK